MADTPGDGPGAPPPAAKTTRRRSRKPAAVAEPAKAKATPGPPVRAGVRVVAVQEDLVRIEARDENGAPAPLIKDELVHIVPARPNERGETEHLKAEVLRVTGATADAQVFEATRGIAVGDRVERSGTMLSVELGPGLLGSVYDGLQVPLHKLAEGYGTFLPRGATVPALDRTRKWSFTPTVRIGATVRPGDVLGTVQEGRFAHKIMVPFGWTGSFRCSWIQSGTFTVDEVVAQLADAGDQEHPVRLVQTWPIRRPLAGALVKRSLSVRHYPDEPLVTTQRVIDTFFPIARGGTACIPGPFGAGKTVLQNLIARHAAVDVVIVVACGERAGEVVETIAEFPKMTDPRTGGTLMDRTIIVCNTSSMPVAAREASINTGLTLGEYYRQMGYDVLLIADSTSRWAQAMREVSGRLEEIPGDEGFPAYLESAIKGVYERAGVVATNDGSTGSLTMIGTVSPAGGNFNEPVTQATLSTVKCFLGLSAERAYKRFYPAIDPLQSWSRYLDQLARWYDANMEAGWADKVKRLQALLRRGDGVAQMMQVTGEEGVSMDDFLVHEKARLIDMAFLQQDAFDEVDATCPLPRQRALLALLLSVIDRADRFADKEAARAHFTKLTGLLKNLNYAEDGSPGFRDLLQQIEATRATTRETPEPVAAAD